MAAVKPKGDLSRYLDATKAPSRLTGPLERHLLTRPPEDRRTDIIHPSALCKTDFCVRASYFVVTGNGIVEKNPGLRLRSIFDEGHLIHHKWQNWLREMGVLYGAWKCRSCGHRSKDLLLSTGGLLPLCGICGEESEYAEVPLVDEPLMMAGHADGWVVGLGADALIEIKSIGPGTIRMEAPGLLKDEDLAGAWRNIRRPFPSHIRQGMLYLELCRRMVLAGLLPSAPTEMIFIYELKMDQAYKEFVVKADPVLVKDMLDLAYDVAYAVRAGKPPVCNISPKGACKSCAPYENTPLKEKK